MSDYFQFQEEKERIDKFLEQGFTINSVTENLNGAYVSFVKKESTDPYENHILHVVSPDGRKYFSVKLIEQQVLNKSQTKPV